ncbi:hypothetical protein [Faecalispora jeddahensis]|uniref:hypothetical protein n=1 Tax=Faecalispora jeddahensis TaxID=1414721 RepID=UPI0027BA0D6D|nr:hypothetical protein [Faecalispora jeddahensis]
MSELYVEIALDMTLTECQLEEREMSMKRIDAEEAIRKAAAKEGLAVEEIRKEIEKPY